MIYIIIYSISDGFNADVEEVPSAQQIHLLPHKKIAKQFFMEEK